MTCLIQVHDTIHDFPKDTHAALRVNGSSVRGVSHGCVSRGCGFRRGGFRGCGLRRGGFRTRPYGGAGRDNDGTMHRVRHDHERIPYPIRHMVR